MQSPCVVGAWFGGAWRVAWLPLLRILLYCMRTHDAFDSSHWHAGTTRHQQVARQLVVVLPQLLLPPARQPATRAMMARCARHARSTPAGSTHCTLRVLARV